MQNNKFADVTIITGKKALARDVYSITVRCPVKPSCGQFAHLRVRGYALRRPISICGYDEKSNEMRMVFQIRGEGTRALAELSVGDSLDIIAPLGHGFTLLPNAKRVILVGGGIGTPPMLPLAEYYGTRAVSVNGFANAESVILNEDFVKTGCKAVICTDDGSRGVHGLVTLPLKEALESGADAVYACGPKPMLRAVAELSAAAGVFCEVSLEERMGCGVGACLVCTCEKSDGSAARVCKDGPVFNASEVKW